MYNEELRASSKSRGRSPDKDQKKIEDKSSKYNDFFDPKKPGPLDHQDLHLMPEEEEEMVDHQILLDYPHFEVHKETLRMMT